MLTLFSALHENHFPLIKQTKIGYDLSSTIYLIKSREDLNNRDITLYLSEKLLFLLSDDENEVVL
jgi:hypothetical protein